MNEAFADTFYWLAVLNPNDAQHGKAMQFNEPARLVTSWAVQIEVMDALCEQRMRPLAARFWKETTEDQDLVLVPLTEDLLHRAAQAPTGDHHFEQAGFLALLR
jgi:predicted nucleic acid-binding protein